MCGIVGVAGNICVKSKSVFKDLLVLDAVRGKHSVGIFSVAEDNSVKYDKEAWQVFDFLDKRSAQEVITHGSKVLVGHNRHATAGSINKVNAHPFDFPQVIGVHNGTLTQRWELPNNINFDVDSESLYNSVNVQGIENTIPKVVGGWSLVFWDKVANTLNFLRNSQRPMNFVYSKDGKTLYFASEVGMLITALDRNGIEYGKIYSTTTDELNVLEVTKEGTRLINKRTLVGKAPHQPANNVHEGNFSKKSTTYGNTHTKRYNVGAKVVIEATSYSDENIEFTNVIGVHKDTFIAWINSTTQYQAHKDLRKLIIDSPNMFEAEIRAYNPQTGKYTLDLRTIEELDSKLLKDDEELDLGDLEDPVQHDYNGRIMTQQQFKEMGDCAWCSDPLVYGETFPLADGGGLCKHCVKQEDVVEYLRSAGEEI